MPSELQKQLLELQDLKYRDFSCKLIPNVDKQSVIGVRTPQLRALAAALAKDERQAAAFMAVLPHRYYEENNLHGLLIERIKDYDTCIDELQRFLPYVDNWATCDIISPKLFKKHLPQLKQQIALWMRDEHPYTVRFAIEMLMSFYLDEQFDPGFLQAVSEVKSDEYYVKMMVAWYFATALAKQYQAALPYLQQNRLDKWTHNKTIQKALESYRVSDEQKAYLRGLKII